MASDMVVDHRTGIFFMRVNSARKGSQPAADQCVSSEEILNSDIFYDQLGKYRYLV